MAHADYHCCAICDDKMAYAGWEATTKEMICSNCVANLALQGVIVHGVDELLNWIREIDAAELERVLLNVRFRFCYYKNDVDDAVRAKGIKPIEGDDVPWYESRFIDTSAGASPADAKDTAQ